jgi:regulator of protease activity HflC (stomatin/prohibitin superfamily)
MLLDRALQIITLAAWLLLAFFVITYLIRTFLQDGLSAALQKLFGRGLFYVALFLAIGLSLLSTSLVFIEPQEVGVVVSLTSPQGYRGRPFRSGLHWIIPLLEQVQRYPISWQTYTMSATPTEGQHLGDDSISARTSDGQEVALDCSIIFQIDPEEATRIHIDWQTRYIEDFIRPVMRGLIRTLVSQYKVDEVNSSKRMDLEADLATQLRAALEEKGFLMDRFLLRNISFSDEYSMAVEQKQVAMQDALRKQYQAEQLRLLAQGEADAALIKAAAEAEAIRLLAAALQENPDVITLRYVDKLAPGIQVMLVPNDAPYILPLPTLSPVTPTPLPTFTPTPEPTFTPTPQP